MKIAIHQRENSYSEKWVEYCKSNNIDYKIVDCYDTNIIDQLSDCKGLIWHWDLTDYKTALFAKQLTLSLEKKGIKVFPNYSTSWHYNDKLGQKYLFESINAPFINTYVFYSKKDARKWITTAEFPLVFKLSGGSGATNVKLVKNIKHANKLINKSFGKGFPSIDRVQNIKERLYKFRKTSNRKIFFYMLKGLVRYFIRTETEKFLIYHKGYIYFQDFIPNNNYDTRVEVIGNRCAALRRYNRKNDFRASGSGDWDFDKQLFDKEMIKLAFDIADKLNLQSVAFDFLVDNNEFKVVEMSYCWPTEGSESYSGYWDSNLNWYEKEITSEIFMLEDFIKELRRPI